MMPLDTPQAWDVMSFMLAQRKRRDRALASPPNQECGICKVGDVAWDELCHEFNRYIASPTVDNATRLESAAAMLRELKTKEAAVMRWRGTTSHFGLPFVGRREYREYGVPRGTVPRVNQPLRS